MSTIAIMKTLDDIRRNAEAASDACLHTNCAKAFDLLEEVINQLSDLMILLSTEE